jgi:dipeptide transport system permease protein
LLKFFLQRVALTVPTFVALMFVTFVAIRLVPGDPVEVRVGERGISPERLAYFRHELGLDQPVWKQFLDYVWQLLHGDFGTSLVTNQKVLTEFATLFPATIELGLAGMLIAVLIGIPAGAMAAVKRGTWYDPAHHGPVGHGLLDADLLVGPHPHHGGGRGLGPHAGIGTHRPHQLLLRADDGLHAG